MRVPDPLVAHFWEPLWDLKERSVRLRTYRELRRRQFDPPAVLAARRSRRLRDLIRHAAATSPFHRERLRAAGIDPDGVRDIADLASLPVLTKADVREHLDSLLSTAYRREDLVEARTGGSTGTALQVFCDRRGVQRRAGAALLADTWSGWRLGQPVAAVWGNPPRPRTLRNRLRAWLKDRWIYLDTMHLDRPAVERFVAQWRRLRPGLLYGHAHSLFLLAEMVREMGVTLRPHGIVATSMMLLEPERRVIEDVFARPVTNRYGCEEVSLIACECERHAGLHVNAEHVWVELLREDGTPCGPGEDGRIVVTELVNRGMPMLRYEVGDYGIWAETPCRCGRSWPLLARVTGRTADFLRARDGSRVAGISLIENTLTRFPGVAQMQIVQRRPDRILVRLVPGADWEEGIRDRLTAVFREALGADMDVRYELVDAIPRERNGKYRFSICELPPAGNGHGR